MDNIHKNCLSYVKISRTRKAITDVPYEFWRNAYCHWHCCTDSEACGRSSQNEEKQSQRRLKMSIKKDRGITFGEVLTVLIDL